MGFDLLFFDDLDILRNRICGCQRRGCVQQVVFSTFHDCLTQICFNCEKIRTTMKKEDVNVGGSGE
jgi:hypothetical protein